MIFSSSHICRSFPSPVTSDLEEVYEFQTRFSFTGWLLRSGSPTVNLHHRPLTDTRTTGESQTRPVLGLEQRRTGMAILFSRDAVITDWDSRLDSNPAVN